MYLTIVHSCSLLLQVTHKAASPINVIVIHYFYNFCPLLEHYRHTLTDCQILSKLLALRLREKMSIIHSDQTYCVPNRFISDNVTLIRDILKLSSSLAKKTGLISIPGKGF